MRQMPDGILVYRFINMMAHDCDGSEAFFRKERQTENNRADKNEGAALKRNKQYYEEREYRN